MSNRSDSLTPPPEYIPQPDHFWGSQEQNVTRNLHPRSDPNATRGIPVFKPTYHEFRDFEKYLKSIEPWGMTSGIVKVVPPQEWTDALHDIRPVLRNVKVSHPIEQNMDGIGGLFRQRNIEKRRVFSVREWVELCTSDDHRTPSVGEDGRIRTAVGSGRKRRIGEKKKKTLAGHTTEEIPHRDDATMEVDDVVAHGLASSPPGPTELNAEDMAARAPVPGTTIETADGAPVTGAKTEAELAAIAAAKKVRAERDQARRHAKVARDETFMDTFDPKIGWLPPGATSEDYTPEFCKVLERLYWRSCGIGKPSLYGADMAGSLFDSSITEWNVANLPSVLSRLLPPGAKVPGVNTPYLYWGMWKATFAWHVEDMDLFSINYIHFGAPKHWYAIPQNRAKALENAMKGFFPGDNSCAQFLRHKSFLASPSALNGAHVKANTLVQYQGEFVITFPRGYHAGFNIGLNCAESVNFALDSWMDLGRKARFCTCVTDSVRIDVDGLLREKAQREEENQRRAEEEKHGPRRDVRGFAPRSYNENELERAAFTAKPIFKQAARKRKLEEMQANMATGTFAIISEPKRKKLRPSPPTTGIPCCLCVSSEDGLLPVHDPPLFGYPGFEPKVVDGKPQWQAHEECAKIVPETWVDEVDGQKFVFGVDAVPKDRWQLKCAACATGSLKSHGAPVQCTKGKCSRSFHVSCAKEGLGGTFFRITGESTSDVLLNIEVEQHLSGTGEGPSNPPNGAPPVIATQRVLKTITKYEIELFCPQHNPVEIENRRKAKSDHIYRKLTALAANSRVRIRYANQYHEATLLHIIPERESVSLNFDNGVTKELKWSSIVWNAAPSGLPTDPGAITVAPVVNGTSNPGLYVPTQPRPQAPAPPRGVIAQQSTNPSNGLGAFPQHQGKVPRGYRALTGHPHYGQPHPHPQPHPPSGALYPGHPSHPYPTPSSSSNNSPSYNRSINFMHYQPPRIQSGPNPKAKVNAYYRPRPALDAEARMQQMGPSPLGPQQLPSSQVPPSPVSPIRDSSTQRPGDAPIPMKPMKPASKNEFPVANQLPVPPQNGDTPS